MALTLFGFRIGKDVDERQKAAEQIPSFVPPENTDAAVEMAVGGSHALVLDVEAQAKTEIDLINRYRDLALQPEVEQAIDDIVNEAIVVDKNTVPVKINLDKIDQPDSIKNRIEEEFEGILKLLNFQNLCYDIFRRWYVDGRLYYHIMVSEKSPRDGIKELRYVDPRRMRKVREPIKPLPQATMSQVDPKDAKIPAYQDWYYYKPQLQIPGSNQTIVQNELRIAPDSICYVHSGLLDQRNVLVLSYLHKAIKPMNQLRTMEDAVVIYRLARAPERRVFYIDVGTLPKMKAEQYMADIMAKNKNRLVYDARTGEIRDDRKFMTMLEDYYLARREGNKGTEITSLAGGQNLGEMTDVDYFKKRLFRALNVPVSRMEPDGTFNLGRASEITRDELKFAKFIQRMRARFTHLFDGLLEIQLALKGVMRRADWQAMRNDVCYDFQEDNFFAESKMSEIMNSRMTTLGQIESHVGKYYSREWVRKNILRMDEDEIKKMQQEMDEENAVEDAIKAEIGMQNLGVGPDGQPLDPTQQPAGQQPQPFGKKPAFGKKPFPPKKKAGDKDGEDPEDKKQKVKKEERAELSAEEKLLVENMTRALDMAAATIKGDTL